MNFTTLDNRLIDDGIIGDLTGAELKVYLVILRKTVGYHKLDDKISISQIEKITKLSRPSVIKALTELKRKGLIVQTTCGKNHINGYGIPLSNDDLKEELTGNRIETSKDILPSYNTDSKKTLPLLTESSKKTLPEVVKKFNPQNKEINNINKLYISSDEDISLEQAQSTQDSVEDNASTSPTKKINKNNNIALDIYKDIENYYKNIYTGTFGRAPIINYGRVRKQIKSILNSGATVEQIKDAISKALADDWVMQGGFNIETILSSKTFNRVLNNPYKTDGQKSYSKEPYDEDEEFRRIEADLYTNDPAYKEWQELKRKKASGELDMEFEEHRAEWEAFKEKMRSAK